MSDNNTNQTADAEAATKEVFITAFFAALTGISGRSAGQDPGTVVNEAYVLAERAAERFSSGRPVMTDAERGQKVMEAAQAAPSAVVSGPNVTQVGGRFQRPAASTP